MLLRVLIILVRAFFYIHTYCAGQKRSQKYFCPKNKRPSFSFFLIGGAVRQFPCSAEVSALPHTSPRSRYSLLPPPLSSPLHFIFHEKRGVRRKREHAFLLSPYPETRPDKGGGLIIITSAPPQRFANFRGKQITFLFFKNLHVLICGNLFISCQLIC